MFNKINSIEDFPFPVIYSIRGRGGYLGVESHYIVEYLSEHKIPINPAFLPKQIGVFCNYLGGGICGSLQCSSYGKVSKRALSVLNSFTAACKRVYETLETFDDEWSEIGTKAARNADIKAAY